MNQTLRKWDAVLGLSFLVSLLFCLYRSQRSLWVDELATAWVVNAGVYASWARAVETQGHSPLYYLLVSVMQGVLGSSELALRALSIFASAATAVFVFLLGRMLLPSRWQARFATAVFCVTSIASVLVAAHARPHALASFFACLALWAMLRWLRNGSRLSFALYLLSSVLTVYAHYLFVTLLLVQCVAFLCFVERDYARRSLEYVLANVLIVLLLLPSWYQLNLLWQKRSLLTWAQPVSIERLYSLLFRSELLSAVVVLAVLWVLGKASFARLHVAGRAFVFLLSWLVVPVLFFYFLALTEISNHFMQQSLLWTLPGTSLLIALLCNSIVEERWAFCVTSGLLLLLFWQQVQDDRAEATDDWRAAIAFVESQHAPAAYLGYPGFIEQNSLQLLQRPLMQRYLTYPIRHYLERSLPIYISPLNLTQSDDLMMRQYWLQQLGQLARYPSIGCICAKRHFSAEGSNCELLARSLEVRGFTEVATKEFGSLRAAHYRHVGIE